MDLKQLHFDHQVQLTLSERELAAAVVAERIGPRQPGLGAAAACAWMANAGWLAA